MARFWSYVASTGENRVLVPLLECGDLYSYTIPSFSVITVQMRRVKYQYITGDETGAEVTKVADGFIRDDQTLERLYPAEVSVKVDSSNACIIHVTELEKSIDVGGLTLVDDGAFVIWKWEWAQNDNSDSSEGEEITVIPKSQSNSSTDESEARSSEDELTALAALTIGPTELITHTVTFKCIGCTKELRYQEKLAEIAQIRNNGQEVPCIIQPEPDNPFDADAIAFKYKVQGTWHTIGYVVKEALKEVHEALAKKEISQVSISWVKFIIYWTVPGWYAGINITRFGEWSRVVQLSQSAQAH